MLPQRDPAYYDTFIDTYNVAELVTSRVNVSTFKLAQAMQQPASDAEFPNAPRVDAYTGGDEGRQGRPLILPGGRADQYSYTAAPIPGIMSVKTPLTDWSRRFAHSTFTGASSARSGTVNVALTGALLTLTAMR